MAIDTSMLHVQKPRISCLGEKRISFLSEAGAYESANADSTEKISEGTAVYRRKTRKRLYGNSD